MHITRMHLWLLVPASKRLVEISNPLSIVRPNACPRKLAGCASEAGQGTADHVRHRTPKKTKLEQALRAAMARIASAKQEKEDAEVKYNEVVELSNLCAQFKAIGVTFDAFISVIVRSNQGVGLPR